jgi:hypothetical protein
MKTLLHDVEFTEEGTQKFRKYSQTTNTSLFNLFFLGFRTVMVMYKGNKERRG